MEKVIGEIGKDNTSHRDKESKLKPSDKLTGADGLRAIACLAVIIHHISQRLMMNAQPSWAQKLQAFGLMGNIGVSIFFVLSGFLLSYPFWKQYLNDGSFPSIKHYVLRRASRIMPGYYIVLIISTMVVIALNIPVNYLWTRVIAGFTFIAGFHYITFFPSDINGPFWSISFEVFCYLLMPICMFGLFKLSRKKRSLLKSLSFWLVIMVSVFVINELIHIFLTPNDINRGWQYGNIGGAKYWMPNYNPIGFFGHFSLGIIAAGVTAALYKNSEKLLKLKGWYFFDIIGLATLLGAFVLLWVMKDAPEFSLSIQNQPYFFPFLQLLIGTTLAVMPHTKFAGKILDNSFFKYTANVSFGLYLWHYLLIYIVSYLWVKDYQYMGVADWTVWLKVSLLIIISAYIIATLSYKFIERPILNWAHKKKFNIKNHNEGIEIK